MELKVTTLEGKEAGSVQLSDDIFGLEPRKDIIQRCVNGNSPSARPAPTRPRAAPMSGAPARRCTSRRAPAVRVTARPECRSSAAAAVRSVRWCARHAYRSAEEGPRAGASPCAVGQGQGRRPDRDRQSATLEAAKTKALIGHFSGLGLTNALIIDGAELHNGFAAAARNIPNIDVLPIQGINVYDILRRQKLVLTKAAVDALEARFK